MRLEALPIGARPPHEVNVVVEVPVGGEPIKYEMHKPSGALVVDRFLYTSMRYPGNYGFIPHTLSDEGDPCDVIIANQRGLLPGSVISVRPVGVLKMQDEAGGDEKIVAVPVPKLTRRYEHASTVLTSNKGFEEWGAVFGDEVMAAALIDRLVHHCHIVTIRGNSYRMRQHTDLWQALHTADPEPSANRRRRSRQEVATA